MEDIIKFLGSGEKITPPENVQLAFNRMFSEAASLEWHIEGQYFESIFVHHGKEIICRFEKNADWVDTRINQSPEEIANKVTKKLSGLGEIMSSIRIEKPGVTEFEFVIRDKDMNRQIYFTDTDGEIIKKTGFNSVYDLF